VENRSKPQENLLFRDDRVYLTGYLLKFGWAVMDEAARILDQGRQIHNEISEAGKIYLFFVIDSF
jgi:hypothetical protein